MRAVRSLAVLSVPVAVAATLALAGCSSDDAPAAAPSATTQGDDGAGDAEDATEDVADGEALTEDNFFEAYVDAMTDAGTYTQSMDMAGTVMDADVVMHDGTADMAMTMSGAGDGMEIVVVDGRVFYQVEGMTQGGFVEADPDDPNDPMGASLAGTIDQMDPEASIAPMKDAMTSFAAADDTEELDGATVREYTIGVDSAAMAANAGLTADDMEAAGMPDELEYNFWVGVDDDLVRKMTYSVAGTDVVMTMSDFGGDQKVEAPTADQMGTLAGS